MSVYFGFVGRWSVLDAGDFRGFERLSRFGCLGVLRVVRMHVRLFDAFTLDLIGSSINRYSSLCFDTWLKALTFAGFECREVVVDGNADLLNGLRTDARQFFKL